MRKWGQMEVKSLVQGYTAIKCLRQNSNSGCFNSNTSNVYLQYSVLVASCLSFMRMEIYFLISSSRLSCFSGGVQLPFSGLLQFVPKRANAEINWENQCWWSHSYETTKESTWKVSEWQQSNKGVGKMSDLINIR